MPSKFLFVGKKKRRPQPFGHCAPINVIVSDSKGVKNHIFVLNYLTVLVYRVSQKFVPLLYKSVFQYDWTW